MTGMPDSQSPDNRPPEPPLVAGLRTPASAAIAGLIFSVVLTAVIVLFHTSVTDRNGGAQWAIDPARRSAVRTALALIPFAGIAFLWFIGVVRTRLGAREDRLFATVFLGSGLLFVGMLFVASAVLTSLLVLYDRGVSVNSDSMLLLQVLTRQLMGTFAARMAAVFTIAVSSIGLRTGLVPRWLVFVGYTTGLVLLASPPLTAWTQLAFPVWVMLLSLHILIASRRSD